MATIKKKIKPALKNKAVDPKKPKETEPDQEDLIKELEQDEKGLKSYHWFLIYLGVFLLLIWVLFFKIIGITHMPNEDMSPRVDAGDLLIFYRLDRNPSFQELVVFEKEVEEGKKQMFVGRVIAVPGDTVDINMGNRPVVNGRALSEPMIFYDTPKRGERVNYPLVLGPDEYFILVDCRKDGMDSRYFGPVKKDEILGTVITVIRRSKL
jgi:signal peptidase I